LTLNAKYRTAVNFNI